MKKLAGNIDIPQSAFFDVLASRPRAYSTSARRMSPSASTTFDKPLDIVSEHLPADLPPPSFDLSPSGLTPGHPLYTPGLTAVQRSAALSELHRLLDQKPVDSPAIIHIFDRLTRQSDTEHVFTPPELTGILRALVKVERQDRHTARKSKETIAKVHDGLSALTRNANRGVEHALLASLQDQAKTASVNLREIETRMAELFPRAPNPTDTLGVKRYRICIHYLLRLYATAGDVDRFESWRQRLAVLGVEDGSHFGLAKLMLATKAGDAAAIASTLEEVLQSVDDPQDQIILVNYALWSLAIHGQWPVVAATYLRLVPSSSPLNLPTASNARPLPLPTGLQPSAQTFSLLLHGLSHQGHFDAALAVLSTMAEQGHQPHVPDYISLFKGFARHGIVPPVNAGRLASSFPLFEQFNTPSPADAEPMSRGQSISQIWQNSVSTQPPASSNDCSDSGSSGSGWTEANLEEIFASFLQLSPSGNKRQAPVPMQIWTIMLAWARTTNASDDVIRSVWDRLEAKFEHEEGWWGWRLDGRLRRLRDRLFQGDEAMD